jgi:hypothetical protein
VTQCAQPEGQLALAASRLDHGHCSHFDREVGGGEAELVGTTLEDEHEGDPVIVATLLVVGEVQAESRACPPEHSEAAPSESFILVGDVEVQIPTRHRGRLCAKRVPRSELADSTA